MNANALQLMAVAGGGALGALARYGLNLWFASSFPGRFNYATLVINVLGSLIIGVAYVLIVEKNALPQISQYLVMVGLLGAFTTFSTFSLETLALIQGGQWLGALAYIAANVVLGLLAVAAGYLLTQAAV